MTTNTSTATSVDTVAKHCESCVYFDLPLYHPHCQSCGGPSTSFKNWVQRQQPKDYEETRSPASLVVGLEQLALLMRADNRIGDAQLCIASAAFIKDQMPKPSPIPRRGLPLKAKASAVVTKADGTIK